MSSTDPSPADSHPAPWWRFPMVWFVLAGPALVVVAASVTAAVAFARADVVIVETPAPSVRANDHAAPTAPALQASKHAAAPAPEPRR
jgi:hypothetical protein